MSSVHFYSSYQFLFTEAASGTFYSVFNGKLNPIYNDFEDGYDEKLRLDEDLNEAVIGHWKSHDGNEEYYSKVRNRLSVQ